MNIKCRMFAVPAIILGLALSADAYDKASDAMNAARQKLNTKNFEGAVKDADEAVQLAGENANEKMNALFLKAQILEAANEKAKAAEILTTVAADAKATLPQKINALNRIANIHLDAGKFDEARAEYAKIQALNGATPADKGNAMISVARAFDRQKESDKAKAEFAKIASAQELPVKIRIDAAKACAVIFANEKKFDEARAEYAKIAAMADAAPADKLAAITDSAKTYEKQNNLVKAYEEYMKVHASKDANDTVKVMVVNAIFNNLQGQKKFEEARKFYLDAMASPDFPGKKEKPGMMLNIAKSYEKESKDDKALEAYRVVFADAEMPKWHRTEAARSCAKILMEGNKFDEARAEYAKISTLPEMGPNDKADVIMYIARSHETQGSAAKARDEYGKALSVEGIDGKMKQKILAASARTYQKDGDLTSMKKAVDKYAAETKSQDYNLLRDYALFAGKMDNGKEALDAWKQILELKAANDAQYAEALFKVIETAAEMKSFDEAKKYSALAASSSRLGDENKFYASLLAAGFGTAKGAAVDCKAVPPKSMNAEKLAKAYTEAAKIFMRARSYDAARFFSDKADAMFPNSPELIYECKFMDKAPFGVSGWITSDIVKDAKRREARFEEYNKKAAALLINDVNVVRDVSMVEKGAKSPDIGFYMAADPRGWHIYINMKDDRVPQILAGLEGGGMLEMYMVPGKGECYYQWMMNPPSEKASFIPWMSPNRNFRIMDDYFKTEVSPLDDGFGIYMFFPWEMVYDKLPKEGDLWTFGLVPWVRNGGFTWGSGQVHELNKFGKIKFTGVEKQLPAIRRGIVMRAFADYKKAASKATTVWKDEVKGDRAFYESTLLPVIEKYNELGKLVKKDMPQSDVDMLFSTVVPNWMEFNFMVYELRSDYLKDKMFKD